MISKTDSKYIFNYAYVPEHLVDYVTSIAGAEPYLFEHYLCYKKNEKLIFIGYPLGVIFRREADGGQPCRSIEIDENPDYIPHCAKSR